MKKIPVILLAMLVMALTLALVSCDEEDETDEEAISSVTSEDIDAALDDIYSNVFGQDFSDLFGSGGEFPDEEV